MIIPLEWSQTLGAGTKVFVLDAGILYENKDVAVVETKNFSRAPLHINARHGDNVARLIAARGIIGQGVAPYCDLYVAKVWDGQSLTGWKGYENGLQWAIDEKADVINLSWAAKEVSAHMKAQLYELDQMGCLCVAAYSDKSWPSDSPHAIAVGSSRVRIPKGVIKVTTSAERLLGEAFDPLQHSSYAAAIVSGVCALAKAADPSMTRTSFLSLMGDERAIA